MGLIGKYYRLKNILLHLERVLPILENQQLLQSRSINLYEKQISSQNGEDGIIEELFRRIGTTNKYFVEFGVENGLQCNTAYLAVYKNWSGLMIEGSDNLFPILESNYLFFPNIKTAHQFITKDNIAKIFKEQGVPKDFDLLSIDIDGNDYWVWEALYKYNPRVVIIEYNASFAPPKKWVMEYNEKHVWDGTNYYGASLTSLAILSEKMGYALVGTDSRGVNAFFLRQDLISVSGFKKLTPEEAYHPPRYGAIFGGHPWRNGSYIEI